MILQGIMSINECTKQLDLLPVEGGEINIAPANMLALKNMIENIPSNSAILSQNNEITEDETKEEASV